MKPEEYPLAWNTFLDLPYWEINLALIYTKDGWFENQSKKSMTCLIPEIDELLERLYEEDNPAYVLFNKRASKNRRNRA